MILSWGMYKLSSYACMKCTHSFQTMYEILCRKLWWWSIIILIVNFNCDNNEMNWREKEIDSKRKKKTPETIVKAMIMVRCLCGVCHMNTFMYICICYIDSHKQSAKRTPRARERERESNGQIRRSTETKPKQTEISISIIILYITVNWK